MTRIVAGDTFQPEEYDGKLYFEATEEEDGSDIVRTSIELEDYYHDNCVTIILTYKPGRKCPGITTEIGPSGVRKES